MGYGKNDLGSRWRREQVTPILATKLYLPRLRPNVVSRPRLLERLNEGLHRKLTLIAAPAGFGKTTLVSEWVEGIERPTAWLSLDEGDNDPARFLAYLVAALQTIAAHIGEGVLGALQSPQPPPTEAILMALLNEITTFPDNFVLVLDDYHVIDAKPVDLALTYLVEHLPPQMHLVIATREDPQLPLARLRARSHLTELRAAELRFTASEAADFLRSEITTFPDNFVLVLDDYHVIDAKPVDLALTYLVEHLPPQMHLVIATREDPQLPLARLRARSHLTELRAAELRFTASEAAEFL